MFLATAGRYVVLTLILSGLMLAQRTTENGKPESTTGPQPAPQQPSIQPKDSRSQIQDDLNRMESLNMNMSSEIEFLHDQNLQILLRTNAQMWTILIRDLRRQLQAGEQHKPADPGR